MTNLTAFSVGALVISIAAYAAISDATIRGEPYVIDGDTLAIGNQHIRLWGIDAPEISQPGGVGAKQMLQHLTNTRGFSSFAECHQKDIDIYRRVVAQCFDRDGRDLGAMLVAFGYAWDYKKYSGGYYADRESAARAEHIGVWSDPAPIPPWQWRAQHRIHH